MENLKQIGWRAFNIETYVNWCGPAQEVIPFLLQNGSVRLVPVLGEAR